MNLCARVRACECERKNICESAWEGKKEILFTHKQNYSTDINHTRMHTHAQTHAHTRF